MIFITGDTHGDFTRFHSEKFPQQKTMTREDYVIICGDFGGIWMEGAWQENRLNQLEKLPFTLLFITGNHENYDLLEKYPVTQWHGGKVQFIRPNVIHLMRGQVFTIEGKTFFAMGGAECHDVWNGVMDPADPDFYEKCHVLDMKREFYRIKGKSWWPQELPNETEYEEAWKNLRAHDMKVDYVISHCAPAELQRFIVPFLGQGTYPQNTLTAFLQQVSEQVTFTQWFFGHYHKKFSLWNYTMIYEEIKQI